MFTMYRMTKHMFESFFHSRISIWTENRTDIFAAHLDLLLGEERRLAVVGRLRGGGGDRRGDGQRGRRPEHEVARLLREVHVRRANLEGGERE